jgi:hypothetical protein
MNINKVLSTSLIAIVSVLAISTIVIAATDLIAPSAPNPSVGTMKTLEDIYQRIIAGTEAIGHTLNPSAGPAGTMHTLTDIYNAVPTNDKVLYGTNGGTANNPAGATEGRTLATADKIISDSFAFSTDGTIINGTGSTGATELEWSADLGAMTWTAAVAYCANPANGYTRLPKLGELFNALSQQFFEGGTEGPGGFVEYTGYWSGSEYDSDYVYFGGYSGGGWNFYYDLKSNESSVRCVR